MPQVIFCEMGRFVLIGPSVTDDVTSLPITKHFRRQELFGSRFEALANGAPPGLENNCPQLWKVFKPKGP